jgi:hypothetical protein
VALFAGLLVPAPAGAAVFNVNSTATTSQCDATTCTLLGALAGAQGNGTAEDDTINVPAGTFQVNASGLNVTTARITIAGAGANATFIQPVQIGTPLTVGNNTTLFEARDLTLRGGSNTTGGNVLVGNSASATFTRVRITAGSANQGGGIAITGATSVTIRSSLIDDNTAGTGTSDIGGGIFIQNQTSGTAVTIDDSTIFRNSGRLGAGIGVAGNLSQPIVMRGVTMSDNRASINAAAMYFAQPSPQARIEGSLVAGNVRVVGQQRFAANCTASPNLPVDGGGNLESASDCGFGTSGHQNADPLLATELDTSQPPVLAIPAFSPAVDIASCGTRTLDQRGTVRPQGIRCDAGAYEVPVAVVTPPPPPPTATPVPTVTPTPTPTPVRDQSVVARPVSGKVLIKLPGAKKFVPLDLSLVKNGAEVDTRKGVVEITQAGGGVAKFFDGIFKLSQSGGVTTLSLTEKLAPCSLRARAAATKPKTRKLWSDGKGKFRTRGQYSAATIRGTKWLVQDGCRYTRTRVTQGVVTVRDEVKKKSIILRKDKSYTARPRR